MGRRPGRRPRRATGWKAGAGRWGARDRLAGALAVAVLVGAATAAGSPALGQVSVAAPPEPAEACPAPAALVGEAEIPLAAVRYVADDAFEGRFAGSVGEWCAGEYIASEFRRLGLEPAGPEGSYFQDVPLASHAHPQGPLGTGRNVLGLLRGSDPTLSREVVVVGAHHDHLGRGGFGSLAREPGEIHSGADDNASGVAGLLTVARLLAAGSPPARSVLFAAFTGEELGLLGSEHYVRHPGVPLERTVAMLNLDMVGRLGDGPLIVNGVGTAAEWAGLLDALGEEAGLPLAYGESGFGPSDHTSFYAREIPVLHFFTNVHADYHRPTDDWEKVDMAGVERVAGLVAAVVVRVADRPGRLAVRPGVGALARGGEGYGAYLGTVPDFTPVERGVRLAGVTAGSPAEEAGLRAEDVIVGLGEHEVGDLHDLTAALRAHAPGDRVEVRALRGGAELVLTAVLGDRARRPQR